MEKRFAVRNKCGRSTISMGSQEFYMLPSQAAKVRLQQLYNQIGATSPLQRFLVSSA